MADTVDKAQELEQLQRDEALAALKQPHEFSREDCAICGEPIPPARRAALPGVQVCIDCQEQMEKRAKVGG